jgi:acid phosphatase (class A)
MKARILPVAIVLCFALATRASAQQRQSYFAPNAVDPIKLLPEFPAPASEEAHDELRLMRILQHDRTQQDVQRCASEVNLSVAAFQSVLGPWCTPDNLPQLSKFLKQVASDTHPFSDLAKDHFKRTRPFVEDSRIQVPIKKDMSYAYPSGHSTLGTMYSMILAELLPEHREAILQRGRDIGWDRVIAGLHHPTDIYAGRILGRALAESLIVDPKFQAELPRLKRELTDAQQRVQQNAHAAEPVGAAR